MLVTCKCLNIIVEAKEVEPRADMKKDLYLLCVENFDNFFKENIQEVKLISATKSVPALINDKRLGSWIVSYCYNCSVNCFAINTDSKIALVNTTLSTTEEAINNLKKNKDFSPAFKMIIQPVSEDLSNPSGPAATGILKKVLTSLQHQLRETIRGEVLKIEESIRIFSEGLYEKLEDFQNRAMKDHKALAHKLRDVQLPPGEDSSDESATIPETKDPKVKTKKSKKRRVRRFRKSTAPSAPLEENDSVDRQNSPIKTDPKTGSLSPSIDTEGLFHLEGMEDEGSLNSGEETDEEEDEEEEEEEDQESNHESESHDEGIDVQHEQTPSCNIAKSLPVEIPPHPPHVYVDKDEVPAKGIDIAASIRALARSVRGDNIFGELPRPRLSSGI